MMTLEYAEDCKYWHSNPSSSHREHFGRVPLHCQPGQNQFTMRCMIFVGSFIYSKLTFDFRARQTLQARATRFLLLGGSVISDV